MWSRDTGRCMLPRLCTALAVGQPEGTMALGREESAAPFKFLVALRLSHRQSRIMQSTVMAEPHAGMGHPLRCPPQASAGQQSRHTHCTAPSLSSAAGQRRFRQQRCLKAYGRPEGREGPRRGGAGCACGEGSRCWAPLQRWPCRAPAARCTSRHAGVICCTWQRHSCSWKHVVSMTRGDPCLVLFRGRCRCYGPLCMVTLPIFGVLWCAHCKGACNGRCWVVVQYTVVVKRIRIQRMNKAMWGCSLQPSIAAFCTKFPGFGQHSLDRAERNDYIEGLRDHIITLITSQQNREAMYLINYSFQPLRIIYFS